MILVILGPQKSPPKTYFFVMIFLKMTYWSKLKTFNLHMFYEEFTSPIHKSQTQQKQWKNKQNPKAPTRHWKSPKLQNLCICNVFAS